MFAEEVAFANVNNLDLLIQYLPLTGQFTVMARPVGGGDNWKSKNISAEAFHERTILDFLNEVVQCVSS